MSFFVFIAECLVLLILYLFICSLCFSILMFYDVALYPVSLVLHLQVLFLFAVVGTGLWLFFIL